MTNLSLSRGFSLIEVMVAMVIMAGLTILTSQAIRSAVDNRSSLSADIARDAQLADALRVIRNDIGLAFHQPEDLTWALAEAMHASPTPAAAPAGGQPPPATPPPVVPPGARTPKPKPPQVTNFVGEPDAVYFTTRSNVRTIRDSHESDLQMVGYFLKSCKSKTGKGAQSNCLFRSASPHLIEDVKKTGPESVLVENVVEFKLRYLGPGKEEAVEQWKTGNGGDASTKENFPYAVEVTLSIHDKNNPKEKPATQTVLAPLMFPNNKPTPKNQPQQGTGRTGGS